ncbi:MAG: glycoside hydrolase family 55 protein [Actinomycetota bacterium]|nr:glycoside hydrolase family 55 protein [Actinomycetota bacterium]
MRPSRRELIVGATGAGAVLGAGGLTRAERALAAQAESVSVKDYGAVGDAVADDTAAIRAAMEATLGAELTLRGGRLLFPKGVYRITDTLTIAQASAFIEGVGWSSSLPSLSPGVRGSVLAWDGPPGRPMLRLDYCWGTTISGLRFVGKSSSKPSAAVSLRNVTGNPSLSNYNSLVNLWVGNLSGYDADAERNQFENGILLEGDDLHNDTNLFRNLVIYGCDVGVSIMHQQYVRNHFATLRTFDCGVGFSTNATISTSGDNWVMTNSSVTDISLGFAARLSVDGFSSECAHRLAQSDSSSLTIRDGYWQIGPRMASDGVVIDGRGGQGRSFLRLEDFDFTGQSSTPARIQWDPVSQVFLSNVVGVRQA